MAAIGHPPPPTFAFIGRMSFERLGDVWTADLMHSG